MLSYFYNMHDGLVKVIGVMSGTSLDGLDIVCVVFDENNYGTFEIQHAETIPYSEVWESKLREGISKNAKELVLLDKEYGVLISEIVLDFIARNTISEIDLIASHGHTILHKPSEGITLQIGNGKIIASKTNQKVICDFRTQDVHYGGQGAPLVPIGDALLFSQYDACLNLGGFANVSFTKDGKRIAFDICPVNIVLNHYVKKEGLKYDDKGAIAESGRVCEKLLSQLNAVAFYEKKGPKSLGLEWVQAVVFPLIEAQELNTAAILRTLVEHMAIQIASSLKGRKDVLITGGGVFNSFLMRRIIEVSDVQIEIPATDMINYKEALIFAFLGLLRMNNQINCLSSVTGAHKDHSSGVLFVPFRSKT